MKGPQGVMLLASPAHVASPQGGRGGWGGALLSEMKGPSCS